MKKDIHIPVVTDVEIAVVLEHNETYNTDDWNVYIINKKEVDLEMIVIVSQGFSENKTTSLFRRRIDKLPGQGFAKFEMMQPEVFALDNRFQVTFFEGNKLYDKTFVFPKNTIKKNVLSEVPILRKNGILGK